MWNESSWWALMRQMGGEWKLRECREPWYSAPPYPKAWLSYSLQNLAASPSPAGLMAASTAASPLVQSQILGHILAPIASQWSDPAWRQGIASPMEFAAKYLPVQQGTGGYLLGAR